jgi:hypothetical protein
VTAECAVWTTALVEYYSRYSTELFGTSMTLGTFIFAMKSFMVQTIKRDVYDTKWYVRWADEHGLVDRYVPLRRLSKLLIWTVSACFASALVNLVFGAFDHWSFAALGCGAAALMFALVAIAVYEVSTATLRMLDKDSEAETRAALKSTRSTESDS